MIRHLIFDFGGVFLNLGETKAVHYNLHRLFNIPEEKAVALWKEHKGKLLLGQETPKEFLGRMNVIMKNSHPIGAVHESWLNLNKIENHQIDWDLVEYVERLSQRYPVHMLTNNIDLNQNSPAYQSAVKHFDTIFQSWEMGHKKPSREAYLHVLEKINAKPEECVLVDDIQSNIDGANAVGIKGIFYTGLEQLKKDFERFGIQDEKRKTGSAVG